MTFLKSFTSLKRFQTLGNLNKASENMPAWPFPTPHQSLPSSSNNSSISFSYPSQPSSLVLNPILSTMPPHICGICCRPSCFKIPPNRCPSTGEPILIAEQRKREDTKNLSSEDTLTAGTGETSLRSATVDVAAGGSRKWEREWLARAGRRRIEGWRDKCKLFNAPGFRAMEYDARYGGVGGGGGEGGNRKVR